MDFVTVYVIGFFVTLIVVPVIGTFFGRLDSKDNEERLVLATSIGAAALVWPLLVIFSPCYLALELSRRVKKRFEESKKVDQSVTVESTQPYR